MKQSKRLISDLYPLTKLFVVLLISAASIFSNDFRISYFLILPMLLLFALLEGCFVSYGKKMAAAMIIMFFFIFVIKGFFDPSEEIVYEFMGIGVKKAGLESALRLTSIILSLGGSLLLFFETTNLEEFMISLQKVGVSHVHAFIFLSTLQMIPEFSKKSKVILQAQRTRGIETEGNLFIRVKAFFPTLTPLIISSISDIEDKVITMEARAFSVETKKTHILELEPRGTDRLIMILAFLLFIGFLAWRYLF